jgi:hypothetical protein
MSTQQAEAEAPSDGEVTQAKASARCGSWDRGGAAAQRRRRGAAGALRRCALHTLHPARKPLPTTCGLATQLGCLRGTRSQGTRSRGARSKLANVASQIAKLEEQLRARQQQLLQETARNRLVKVRGSWSVPGSAGGHQARESPADAAS